MMTSEGSMICKPFCLVSILLTFFKAVFLQKWRKRKILLKCMKQTKNLNATCLLGCSEELLHCIKEIFVFSTFRTNKRKGLVYKSCMCSI